MAKFMFTCFYPSWGCFPSSSVVKKNPPANTEDTGDMGFTPGLERRPGGGNDNPLQYSCLKNPMTEELGRLQSIKSQRVGCDLVTKHALMHPSWGSQNSLPLWIYALHYLCSFYFYFFIYLAMLNSLWESQFSDHKSNSALGSLSRQS